MDTLDVAIIGAGPYGLSLAAHLAPTDLKTRVFGQPMRFWREQMPEGMVLKSEGFASNLWDPAGSLTLKAYCAEHGLPYKDTGLPIPLQTFCDYGNAFQKRLVPNLDERFVYRLDEDGGRFTLRLQDGHSVSAKQVVLATGIGKFQYIPDTLAPIAGPLCTHSTEHRTLDRFAGKHVLVIGGGASGVELAGLMSQKGAHVSIATRQDRIPFCNPPAPRGLWERARAPETGLGYGWRSLACVYAPMVFYHMPRAFRHMVVRKHLGPAPGWTSRAEVERNVSVTLSADPIGSSISNGRPCVDFQLSDGTRKTIEADHVIAATGFKVDMHRLRFISQGIMQDLDMAEHTPVLSPYFETSVPGFYTAGVTAANCFGPLLRFAYGAGFASRRLSRHLAQRSRQRTSRAARTLAPA